MRSQVKIQARSVKEIVPAEYLTQSQLVSWIGLMTFSEEYLVLLYYSDKATYRNVIIYSSHSLLFNLGVLNQINKTYKRMGLYPQSFDETHKSRFLSGVDILESTNSISSISPSCIRGNKSFN